MAHFLGQIQSRRGKAQRLGDKSQGLTTIAASWQGAVEVSLFEADGVDWARVALTNWKGQGVERVLYSGPVSGKKPKEGGKK